jgi:hypothetical protein
VSTPTRPNYTESSPGTPTANVRSPWVLSRKDYRFPRPQAGVAGTKSNHESTKLRKARDGPCRCFFGSSQSRTAKQPRTIPLPKLLLTSFTDRIPAFPWRPGRGGISRALNCCAKLAQRSFALPRPGIPGHSLHRAQVIDIRAAVVVADGQGLHLDIRGQCPVVSE